MSPARRRRPLLLRIIRSRPRLFTSVAISIVVAAALAVATNWRTATCLLVGWDIGVALYLVLAAHLMAYATIDVIRHYSAQEDEGELAILILTVSAALASVGAIFGELSTNAEGAGGTQLARVIFAALTILLSWAFIHTIFALHYAHEYYDDDTRGGMAFPGGEVKPDYWDFVYFSLVIGMTSQVSDVAITSKRTRRTVSAHAVVSFIFNTALLALTVNLAAGLI